MNNIIQVKAFDYFYCAPNNEIGGLSLVMCIEAHYPQCIINDLKDGPSSSSSFCSIQLDCAPFHSIPFGSMRLRFSLIVLCSLWFGLVWFSLSSNS